MHIIMIALTILNLQLRLATTSAQEHSKITNIVSQCRFDEGYKDSAHVIYVEAGALNQKSLLAKRDTVDVWT